MAEIQAAVESGPCLPLPCRREPQAATSLADLWSAGNVRIPVPRQAKANPQFILSNGLGR